MSDEELYWRLDKMIEVMGEMSQSLYYLGLEQRRHAEFQKKQEAMMKQADADAKRFMEEEMKMEKEK